MGGDVTNRGDDGFAARLVEGVARFVHDGALVAGSPGAGWHGRTVVTVVGAVDGVRGVAVDDVAVAGKGDEVGRAGGHIR